MSAFTVHTEDTAPEASREALAKVKQRFGRLPNLYGIMAESPAAITGYSSIGAALQLSTLTPAEQQLLMLVISRENGCDYCVAAHSAGARRAKLDAEVIQAVRDGDPIPDARLQALGAFCQLVVEKRGWVSGEDIDAFLAAGFAKANVMDVVLVVGMKTISNYINHVAETELDAALEPLKWEKPKAA